MELALNNVIPDDIMHLISKFYEYGENIINAKLIYLGSIKLQTNWSMKQVKKAIFNEYRCTVNYSKMRIRDFHDENKLTQIFYDNCSLDQNCKRIFNKPSYDGTRICCQELLKNEYFTADKVLLNVSRIYFHHECQYEEFNELSFDNDLNISKLRKELKVISDGMIENENDIYFRFMTQESFQQVIDTESIYSLYSNMSQWIPHSSNKLFIDDIVLSKQCKTGDVLLYKEWKEE